MLIKDFEKKIQEEFNTELNIRTNKNSDDIAGIYLGNVYIGISVPPKEIFEEKKESYSDSYGFPYRCIDETLEMLPKKIERIQKMMKEDPELFDEKAFKKMK